MYERKRGEQRKLKSYWKRKTKLEKKLSKKKVTRYLLSDFCHQPFVCCTVCSYFMYDGHELFGKRAY